MTTQRVVFKITTNLINQQFRERMPTAKKGRVQGLDTDDYYFTPEGFMVFTAAYHLKRGYCCKNACRHCPYGYKKVEK